MVGEVPRKPWGVRQCQEVLRGRRGLPGSGPPAVLPGRPGRSALPCRRLRRPCSSVSPRPPDGGAGQPEGRRHVLQPLQEVQPRSQGGQEAQHGPGADEPRPPEHAEGDDRHRQLLRRPRGVRQGGAALPAWRAAVQGPRDLLQGGALRGAGPHRRGAGHKLGPHASAALRRLFHGPPAARARLTPACAQQTVLPRIGAVRAVRYPR
mmetsp:Transcript_29038/g.81825  ORF Transcript_29038/g.81825 Transcript_29038/m.81825 type:complete len:207 (+) Transcript_29038:2946-3566(+)